MQVWSVIEGDCATPGAEGYPVFGVQAVLPNGGVWTWADVDTDLAAAQELACRLQAIQPDPCHFEDMVLDFIAEMAAKV